MEKKWEQKLTKKGPSVVNYVGKVLELKEDGHVQVLYARCKSVAVKDTFHFPNLDDVEALVRSRVLGVLTVKKGETARQANLIKVFPPLPPTFNIR